MNSKLHIAMFPWLAFGHFIPFLELANEIAKRGHKITLLIPNNALLKLAKSNLHPHLITLHGLTVPHVDGLPRGAETTSDSDNFVALSTAMDRMQDQVRAVLEAEHPDFVFFDSADWVPGLASEIGCKTLSLRLVTPALVALTFVIVSGADERKSLPNCRFSGHVSRAYESFLSVFGDQPENHARYVRFMEKIVSGAKQSDAIAFRTCLEMEATYCEHVAEKHQKPVFCTGPLLPEPREEEKLEAEIANWLEKFEPGSVVFCAFGSETALGIAQFQELVSGLELAGLPFLVAVPKPPQGAESIREALPEGFREGVKEKGLLHEGWVSQTLILKHKSVGCFVCHGGSASMWESLVSDCRIVAAPPNRTDYNINAMLMAEELGVAVQVERGENGWFSKESLSRAIKSAMDEDSEFGVSLKENHKKWRDLLLSPGFADDYIDRFIQKLYELLGTERIRDV